MVTLQGRVDDDDSRDEITDVVRRVEGVRLVLNQMKTDEEVMTAPEFATRELSKIGDYFARKWLLVLVALGIAAFSALLARLFAAHSETLLAPFVHNVLLRSVVGSLISSMLVIGGLLLALSALKLTQAVLSILGLAGVVGLAVGFAFRDITENFIASVLLGVRRPFQIGDYVTVAGQSGVVKSLNTRATVLVTLEGNHVRIPNAVIFKEIMVNATASASFRSSFDVLIPPEASTADALAAIAQALARSGRHPRRPAPARRGRGPGAGRGPAAGLLLVADARRGPDPAPERRQAEGPGRAPAGGRLPAAGNRHSQWHEYACSQRHHRRRCPTSSHQP